MVIRPVVMMWAAVLGCLLLPSALAEPWIAVQTGSKCVACHVSPTGGGKRTPFGAAMAQTALSAGTLTGVWNGIITDRFSVGADARGNLASTRIPQRDDRFEFALEEALIYAEFHLIADKLSLYVDERVGPGGATNREAYALFWFKDKRFYARAGRMFLPYGWRIEDDTAFIRQVPGINYATPDDGMEVGYESPSVSLNLAVTNGTAGAGEVDRGKQFSLRGSYIQPKWRVGASMNFNDVSQSKRTMGNVFAGLATGPVNWLFEIDYVDDRGFATGPRRQWIGFAEANYWLRKGHNLKLTYEFFDPDDDVEEDERNRYSVVYEYFPMTFVQLIGGWRVGDGIEQSPQQNTDEIFLQLHTYF
ncbi:MAG: hypothetical protein AB8G17_15230 [Gammaproteobacteria bacterium]